MRAPALAPLGVVRTDPQADLFVGDRMGAHRAGQLTPVRVQAAQPLHVARVAHVHRRGQRGDACPRPPVAVGQELRHGAVGIVRQLDRANRQTHAACPQAGQHVAEVAGGNDERRRRTVGPPQLEARRRVVDRLRQQAADVDAVGRGQLEPRAQLRIRESLFHQPLAIVEGALHRQRADVVAPAGELLFLARRHQSLRVEHHHARPGPPMEGGGDRTPGITGGGHQDRQRPGRIVWLARQAGRQEARAEVLERGRRPVEQLEHRQRRVAGRDAAQQRRKGEGLARRLAHPWRECVTGKERREQPLGNLRQRLRALERSGRQHRQAFRDMQPAIRGNAAADCRRQRGGVGRIAGADEAHQAATIRAPSVSIADTQLSVARSCSAKASTMATRTPSA